MVANLARRSWTMRILWRSTGAGPIQGGGGTEFFEIRDSESNVIEICKEL